MTECAIASASTSAAPSPISRCSTTTAGEIAIHKRLTTPDDPAAAVLEGAARALAAGRRRASATSAVIAHGTTLVTNAVIERRGAPTAMLVTAGFRDVLDIGMERRYDLFDLRIRFPEPVVPRPLRFEVARAHRATTAA